jgi:dUTP pyrophosphatase
MIVKAVITQEELKPKVGTEYSAGIDLRVSLDVVIKAKETQLVGTGLKIEVPEGHMGMLIPRSSTGKLGLTLANTVGIIDSDYRGEIKLLLTNNTTGGLFISKATRLVQLIIVPVIQPKLMYVDTLDETVRGEGGFGHTGDK